MGKDLKGNELGKGFGQRKNGDYYFRFTNRFNKRETIYEKKLSILKKKAKTAVSLDEVKQNISNSKITMNELFDQWINIYKKHEIKESTYVHYNSLYNRYIKSSKLGELNVSKITPLVIKEFYNKIVESGLSSTTCHMIKLIIDGMFALALTEEYIAKNKIKNIKIISKQQKKVVLPLSISEQKLVLKYSKNSYYNLYTLILNTGLRIGEALALNPNDIDFENMVLNVDKTIHYHSAKGYYDNGTKHYIGSTKSGKSRKVPLNIHAKNALLDQLEIRNKMQTFNVEEALLFVTRNGKPMSYIAIDQNLNQLIERINKKEKTNIRQISSHVLRHTFATRCYEAGIPLIVIQNYLGHSDINITASIYVDSDSNSTDMIKNIENIND